MAHEDNRTIWEMQCRSHSLVVVLPMNYVRRFADLGKIVYNRDSRSLQLLGNSPKLRAVCYRIVSFSNKRNGQVTNDEF